MPVEADERLLLIDDDSYFLQKMKQILEARGYKVDGAQSPREALELVGAKHYTLVITDLAMPGTEGLSIYQAIRKADPFVPVIVMTGYGSPDQAAMAMKIGCTDYLRKPVDPDELVFRIRRVSYQSLMETQVVSLRAQLGRSLARQTIVGESAAIRGVVERIGMVANSDLTVLIRGETGTGKELVARAIHNGSPRAKHPFIAVACGAIPRTLFESQLFGHRRGSFTGADKDQMGLLELTELGTLFLDEISEIDVAGQIKLLRFLELGEVRPLGSTKTRLLDVRLIAASNLDLEQAIRKGLFREDIFYRLNVFPIFVPPLRDRREDIPLLVKHFAKAHSYRLRGENTLFQPETIEKLVDYDWPGNVRELENKVQQLILLARGRVVEPSIVELPLARSARTLAEVKEEAINRIEHQFVRETLSKAHGVIVKAAKLAGLHPKNFSILMRKYGIRAEGFRNQEGETETQSESKS